MPTLTFDDLIIPAERPFLLRGKTYPLRFVSAADMAVVESALPMPEPPLVDDMTRGSNAPKVPNFKDPNYLRECDAVFKRWELARGAIALRYKTREGVVWGDEEPESTGALCARAMRRASFVVLASTELGATLTDAEAVALRKELAAFTAASLTADAVKN